MKFLAVQQSRDEYLHTQIERSNTKFKYCKVSVEDAGKYASLIDRHRRRTGTRDAVGPILCLGTRNGREVDLFRIQFFGPTWRKHLCRRLERRTHSFTTLVPWIEARGRSDAGHLESASVIGVEVNPRARRPDVWIGSFDDMPADWSQRFGVVYSNAFDQSENPVRTAEEWRRVLRPGGYLIFCYANDVEPTIADRVGGLCFADVRDLFPGELIYLEDRGSRNGYSEVITRL